MKTLKTKLALTTETLRSLTHTTLEAVYGGVFSGDVLLPDKIGSKGCPIGSCVPGCTQDLPGTKTAETNTVKTLGPLK